MKKQAKNRWLFAVTAIFITSLACSLFGGGNETPDAPTPRSEDPGVTEELQDDKPRPVSSLNEVKSATIQIEAQGTFVDPQVGLVLNAAGRGSGFIIDPSGLAITNNHVVTGAALLQVWVGGESSPRNARVLGVSECSDLAVIDIDGDDYPYLDWFDGDLQVGLGIYAAGYPLGDPEYTLLQGVVSKENASGESNWASVDSVIEHTALTNPGNSGGPIVTEDGRVVAVHYAGNSETEQHFAIARDEALPVIDRLRSGEDVNSIGMNGTAVRNEDGSISGIWVSSVASGSPADRAGITGGDILITMEGLVLATDGTMSSYCDILRTHQPEDTLSIEVFRFDTGEFLEGQLNGRELATTSSFGSDFGQDVPDAPDTGSGSGYSNYTTVTDDFGSITVDVPVEWGDVNGSPWIDGGDTIGASIWASSDLDGFINTWGTPGMIFNVSDDLAQLGGYIQLLDIRRRDFIGACDFVERGDYEDSLYRGSYDLFEKCGGSGGPNYVVLSAVSREAQLSYLILVEVQIVTDADITALERILDTFQVIGSLP